jgi:hypothetical protein
MRADKTEPRRRHIRLETGAQAATAVRGPQKTPLFEVPLSEFLALLPPQVKILFRREYKRLRWSDLPSRAQDQ